MVSMHEQLAPLTLAPILNAPASKIPPPRNRQRYRTLMVGGHEFTHRDLAEPLERYGIGLLDTHWHTGRSKLAERLPMGTELVLLVTTVTGHNLSDHANALCKRAGVPLIGISTKQSSWPDTFARWGLTSPPSWLKAGPALTVVTSNEAVAPAVVSEPTPDQAWGEILRGHRRLSGLSRAALAERIGVSDGSIIGWERGERSPKYAYYKAILEALPGLRSEPPPPALRDRVFEVLAPTPTQIAEAAPTPEPAPALSKLALLGVNYAETVARAEALQRQADDALRASEEFSESARIERERAESIKAEIFAAAKG